MKDDFGALWASGWRGKVLDVFSLREPCGSEVERRTWWLSLLVLEEKETTLDILNSLSQTAGSTRHEDREGARVCRSW